MTSTVILGAGIMGCSTAYFLSDSHHTEPHTIHLVEASPELFASASGKSGGFLASDWFGPAVAPLGALSFRLHKELAEKYDGKSKWGYSRSTGTSLTEGSSNGARGDDWLRDGGSRAEAAGLHEFEGESDGPAWLTRRHGQSVETIAADGSVAQVDPLRLSRFLLAEAQSRGVQLHQPARAISLTQDATGALTGITIQNTTSNTSTHLPCTRLLLTSGAWTPHVFRTIFPTSRLHIPITPLAGHSLVVRSPRWTSQHEEASGCHAIFTTMRSGFSPEIFSRIGSEIYVAGLNDSSIPLPQIATEAHVQPADIEELTRVAKKLLGRDGTDVGDLEVLRTGLCFRPVTGRGTPILARVPDGKLGGVGTKGGGEGGVFICAGHGPWGISHSLGTGKVMAEMLEGRPTSANVKALGL